MVYYCLYKCPVGNFLLLSSGTSLIRLHLKTKIKENWILNEKVFPFLLVKTWLDEYFKKKNQQTRNVQFFTENKWLVDGIPIELDLKTSNFQRSVLRLATKIDFGKKKTYKDLSIELHSSTKFRACGRALSANPFLLLIPCHRVIGSSGELIGYSGGLPMKISLLKHEGVLK